MYYRDLGFLFGLRRESVSTSYKLNARTKERRLLYRTARTCQNETADYFNSTEMSCMQTPTCLCCSSC